MIVKSRYDGIKVSYLRPYKQIGSPGQ